MTMPNVQHTFQQIVDVSLEFGQAKDIDVMLERILSAAQRLANAEAGAIYIAEDDVLRRHHTQQSASATGMTSKGTPAYDSKAEAVEAGSLAAYIARTGDIVNIADVQRLPDDAPYTVSWPHGSDADARSYSLIAFPIKNAKRKVLAVVELLNPHDDAGKSTSIAEDELPLLRLFATNAASAIERARATRARIMGILQVLTTLRNTEETLGHFHRVGAYAAEIYETWAAKQGLDSTLVSAQKDILRTAAMLHDISKLAIPDIIRSKPGRLTEGEYATMKQHTVKGAQLLLKYAQSGLEKVAAEIALTHHERWDGNGYPGHVDPESALPLPDYTDIAGKPRGKKGEEIPVFGRVVAIADAYDSLLSDRIYRSAWKEADVLAQLRNGSGSLFEPSMIEAFFESLAALHAVAQRYTDE